MLRKTIEQNLKNATCKIQSCLPANRELSLLLTPKMADGLVSCISLFRYLSMYIFSVVLSAVAMGPILANALHWISKDVMLAAAQAGRRMKIVRKIVAVAMMMMKRIFINLQLQTTINRVKVGQLKFELKNKNLKIC